jgi:hypothetical protein
MFIPIHDAKSLRQGDIIAGIYYPLLKHNDLTILGKQTETPSSQGDEIVLAALVENKKYVQGLIKFIPTLAIVASQCCDVEAKDGKLDVPAFVLVPLEPLRVLHSIAKDQAEIDKLKMNDPSIYSNLFYLEATAPIQEPSIVNFNKVFSVQQSDYPTILTKKVLQMSDENRILFKVKLAHHFGRPTEEELKKNLFPKQADSTGKRVI